MSDQQIKGWVFMLIAAVVLCGIARLLAELSHHCDSWRAKRKGELIECDLCDELMRPDGLHWIEDRSLFFPSWPRIYRHPAHIVRTEIFKQPIIDERLKSLRESRRARRTEGEKQ